MFNVNKRINQILYASVDLDKVVPSPSNPYKTDTNTSTVVPGAFELTDIAELIKK